MEMRDGVDFERKIYVKQHAAEMLRRDLRRVKPDEGIAIGTATDPYQPAEKKYEVTRAILEEMARQRGLEIGIVSKSTLMLRDIDVLRRVAERNRLFVNVTITTLNVGLARMLEPRAPRPDLRLDALRKLNEAGISTVEALADMTPEQLEEVPGVGPKTVEKISIAVNNYFSTLETTPAAAVPESGETAAVEGGAVAEPVAEIAAAEEAATEYAEAVETGQGSEAAAIAGVENAPDADVAEVHTHGEDQPVEAGLVEPELAKPDEESEEELS